MGLLSDSPISPAAKPQEGALETALTPTHILTVPTMPDYGSGGRAAQRTQFASVHLKHCEAWTGNIAGYKAKAVAVVGKGDVGGRNVVSPLTYQPKSHAIEKTKRRRSSSSTC